MNLRQAKYFLSLLTLLLLSVSTLQAKPPLQDDRDFPETGFGVDNDVIWDYFQSRGGVDTFGYPVSDLLSYRGFEVQIFQRHVLQLNGEQARPLNLLDPDVMPINSFGGLSFPAYDEGVAEQAPAPDSPNYGSAVRQHLEAEVPETWQDESVGFLSYYLSPAPQDAGNLGSLLALEVWGFPTSSPKRDPLNENFIYQRFQRGIMHYDASSQITAGILLGDAFKQMIESGGTEPPEPTDDSPEALIGNTLLLYTVLEEGVWALKSWPDETLLSNPVFELFYGKDNGDENYDDLVNQYLSSYHPKLSPNGRYLLLPGFGGSLFESVPHWDSGVGLWLVDLVERTSRLLLPQAQIATWNPESDEITYVEEGTLYTLNIFSQEPVPLFSDPDLLTLFAHWSPDGNEIAVMSIGAAEDFSETEKTYWAIPTNGDAPRQIVTLPIDRDREALPTLLEWSPDSEYLLLKFHEEVYDLAGDQVLTDATGPWQPNQAPATVLSKTANSSKLITASGQEAATVASAWVGEPTFSKDGQRLAYFVGDDEQSQLKVFDVAENKNIDVTSFTTSSLERLFWNADSSSLIYQRGNFGANGQDDNSIWIVPAEANQPPIELFSPGVLVGVVPMPTR